MNRTLKRVLIIVGSLVVLLVVLFQFFKWNTKQASPEDTVTATVGAATIEIQYSQPSVKGREIFGGLVPYGEVWRTGANEATTFTTSSDLTIGEKTLPAGEYTLWTIPNPKEWLIIWNSKQYSWGVNIDEIASREGEFDVLSVAAPVEKLELPVEKFTMTLVDGVLTLSWDQVSVSTKLEG